MSGKAYFAIFLSFVLPPVPAGLAFYAVLHNNFLAAVPFAILTIIVTKFFYR